MRRGEGEKNDSECVFLSSHPDTSRSRPVGGIQKKRRRENTDLTNFLHILGKRHFDSSPEQLCFFPLSLYLLLSFSPSFPNPSSLPVPHSLTIIILIILILIIVIIIMSRRKQPNPNKVKRKLQHLFISLSFADDHIRVIVTMYYCVLWFLSIELKMQKSYLECSLSFFLSLCACAVEERAWCIECVRAVWRHAKVFCKFVFFLSFNQLLNV